MNSSAPKVSIIIPCYNHGSYLLETLESIQKSLTQYSYEVVIVNDGSTDVFTNELLKDLSDRNYIVVFQENTGVCEARNVGIRRSRGEFILPVDADNRIMPQLIEKSANVLEFNPEVSVVYSDAVLIGERTGIQTSGQYNLQRLMLDNFIDNCSMYRRAMWEKLGGYESSRAIAGLEDWEFWLRASFQGYKFHYINEVLFEYRVLSNSGIRTVNANKNRSNRIFDFFVSKMPETYGPNHVDEYLIKKFRKNPFAFILKLVLKAYLPEYFNRFVNEGRLRRYI